MKNQELFNVLLRINETRENQVERDTLEQVLAIVIMNPLPEDRAQCQDQLMALINQKIR